MMIRGLICGLSLAMLTVAPSLTEAGNSAAPASNPIRFRLSVHLPFSSKISENVEAFKEKIELKLRNSVEIEILYGIHSINDQLVGAELAKGTVDMAVVNIGTLPGNVPVLEFVDYPFLLNSEALVRAVMDPNRSIRPLLDKAILDASRLRVIWWQPFGSNVLFSKGRNAASPSALAERKVRVHSAPSGQFLKECGAAPIIISDLRQKDALEAGDVEYLMTSVADVETWRLWEVSDTLTRLRNSPIEFVVAINEKSWQRLSPAQQDAFKEVSREVEKELRENHARAEAAHYEFAQRMGMKIVELRPDQLTEWRACSSPAADRFMDRNGEQGFYLMAAYGRLRTDPCCGGPPPAAPETGAIRPASARP